MHLSSDCPRCAPCAQCALEQALRARDYAGMRKVMADMERAKVSQFRRDQVTAITPLTRKQA